MPEYQFMGDGAFYGYDRRPAAGAGTFPVMRNLTAKDVPCLASRPRRRVYGTGYRNPQAVYGADKLYVVADGRFYADGELIKDLFEGEEDPVRDGERKLLPIGNFIVIYPDMWKYGVDDGVMTDMKTDGIRTEYRAYLSVGEIHDRMTDTVYIHADADAEPMLRAGQYISFTERKTSQDYTPFLTSWEIERALVLSVEEDVTLETPAWKVTFSEPVVHGYEYGYVEFIRMENVRLEMPAFDGIMAHDNRFFGYRGHDIKVSALGEPMRWEDYSGLTTGSWAASLVAADVITGCAVTAGTPTFFCENAVYKIYGSNPTEYGYTRADAVGLKAGEARSVASGGQYTFYVSRRGICAYNGGIPTVISGALGDERFIRGVGGSDGVRYWLSCVERDGVHSLLNWDPSTGIWMREDELPVHAMTVYRGNAAALTEGGDLIALGACWEDTESEEEPGDIWFECETAESADGWYARKGNCDLLIDYEAGDDLRHGALMIRYDGGEWERLDELKPGGRRVLVSPLRHALYERVSVRIEGYGSIRVWSVTRRVYATTERR